MVQGVAGGGSTAHQGEALLAGTGTLSADGIRGTFADAALTGTGTLAANGTLTLTGASWEYKEM